MVEAFGEIVVSVLVLFVLAAFAVFAVGYAILCMLNLKDKDDNHTTH